MAERRLQIVLDVDTGRATARLSEAGKVIRDFGLNTQRSGQNLREMGRGFDSMHSGMQRPLAKLRDYVLILGNLRFALLNVRDIAVGWVAGLVKQAGEMERLTVLMKNFSKASTEAGRNEEAQRNLRDMMTLANRTGFEMKTMTDAFVKFQSADLNPQVYSLRGLANSVAKFGGDSDTMHRAAVAIQQMAGKGVISMEELRQQLGEAVPSALKTLAASLGMTVGETTKAVSKGMVVAKPALELMLRDMEITSAGAGERIANTLFGQLAQVKTGMMQLSTDFTGLGQTDSFFSGIVAQLKEINTVMRSGEARQAMQALGQSIDHIATSIASGIKWIIEWRNQIGAVLMVALKVWVGIKAVQIGQWFGQMAQAAAIAVRNIVSGTREMTGVSGEMFRWGTSLKQSVDAQRQATQDFVTVARQRVTVAQQNVISTQLDIDALTAKTAALDAQRLATINDITAQRQRVVSAQQSIMLAQRDIDQMGTTKVRTDALARSKNNLGMETTRLNELLANLSATERQLATSSQELAAAESNLQRAMAGEAAAVAVVNVAERTNAASKGFMANAASAAAMSMEMLTAVITGESTAVTIATIKEQASTAVKALMATAARAAGAAVAFMGEMVNLALGPIGLFIIACQQLASWLNADKVSAEQATEAIHNYVGAMANMESIKKVQSRIKQLDGALGEDSTLSPTEAFMKRNRNPRADDELRAERDRLRNYVTQQAPNAAANLGRQQAETLQYERQNYTDRLTARKDFQDRFQVLQQEELAGNKTHAVELQNMRDSVTRAQVNWQQGLINGQRKLLTNLRNMPQSQARDDRINAAVARLGALNQQMDGLKSRSGSAALQTEALSGKVKGTGDAAGKAANRVANLTGNVAALTAAAGGDKSTNLIKFMATLNAGGFKGKSQAEISLLRQQALLKDSIKDNAAGMAAGESAATKYQSMMARVTGRVAELNDELQGGQGNLAKFEAQMLAAPDAFKGFSPQMIATLKEAFKGLDDAEHSTDVTKVFTNLGKELTKASESTDALWASFNNGTIEADQHTDQLRGRFMSLIEGMKLGPEELEKFKGKVDEVVAKLRESEAVLEAHRLDQETKKINNSLIGDDKGQRIAEYQTELEEEQRMLATSLAAITGNTADAITKRKQIMTSFFEWQKAKQAELARSNETSTVKMMRDWAQLGTNVERVMSGAISSFVDQLASGKLNMKEFAKDILKELLKVILQALIAYAILSALGMTPTGAGGKPMNFGQYMKSSMASGFGGGAAPTWTAPKHHDGGIIGQGTSFATVNSAMFDGAFKYHGGGMIDKLGPKEVPMIGLEGERVLTEDDQRALASGGQKPNVQVNVINNGSEQLGADVSTDFNGKDMIISVVLDAMHRQGPLRDGMSAMTKK